MPGYLDQAFEAALDSGGAILSVMSSVVAVTFGIPIRDPDSESIDQRNQAVARLLKDLGPNVRVISGRVNGLYGVVGSAHRVSFQALIPDFAKSLESLLGLKFGDSGEIQTARNDCVPLLPSLALRRAPSRSPGYLANSHLFRRILGMH